MSKTPVIESLKLLAEGKELGEELSAATFGQLMRGDASEAQTGALLAGLRVRGESAAEVAGAVRALRQAMVTVQVPNRFGLVDTCGTGGGNVSTFNISTVAAFVAVGAGARVAKHGNRSYTSRCGSADVLEALGISISADAVRASEVLDRAGMVFLFAPAFHPAMRFVAPVRRDIAIPTIMNLVGPLANPTLVTRQLVGVADPGRGPLLAEVLARLGAEHAMVVHGSVGMDEIAPCGTTRLWEVRSGTVSAQTLDPTRHGVMSTDLASLAGGSPEENAARATSLLEAPQSDPAGRAAVVLNAGAAIYVAGVAPSLEVGFEAARTSLESGAARDALERLRREAAPNTS